MILKYETRDAKGNDFLKTVETKHYPVVENYFICPICHKECTKGIEIKKIISSNFTDFAYIDKYVCEDCSALFSLYFYSYIADDDGIRLLNLRQIKDELCRRQKPPFRFIITTSQKKHLFYRSKLNYRSDYYAVNLETEIIYTSCDRMKLLFEFVENMMVLGASKKAMAAGEIPFTVMNKIGSDAWIFLNNELTKSQEIQIPLYCGQKLDIEEEAAIWNLNSLLMT